ncbi:hypothetical protein SAMN02927900_03069 [Rhizobium mongolense subsp. loessense]|uniref:Uncharacterized protein n=1 Tax=Rhizobium mongolense subsp. loessense TaxID=158890 RepID=A0A1G4RVM4_9HYPH|nr:hypothetical protein SAMN02927900_03069 [Rhizobium mongolense subsp. loessense]
MLANPSRLFAENAKTTCGPGTNEFPNRPVIVLLDLTMREELLRERKGAGRLPGFSGKLDITVGKGRFLFETQLIGPHQT